jgi:prepilin-type N-terminal cleavage/methylation domain-containing protein
MGLEKSRSSASSAAGFSLVEVLIATVILAVALVSLAQLFALSTRSNMSARNTTYTAVLAQQKLEELRSLTWGFDTQGLPISDTATNTAVSPETPAGGTGLSPSPAGTLGANTNGYVDFVDQFGNKLGGGGAPPAGTVFVRRWSVEPLPSNPNNTLVLQVLVFRNRDRGTADDGAGRVLPEEARLVTVKTRKAQ